jgi:hypothetical protein
VIHLLARRSHAAMDSSHVGVLVEHLRTNPALRRAEKYLGPLIQERLDNIADHGKDYADKPVSKGILVVTGSH